VNCCSSDFSGGRISGHERRRLVAIPASRFWTFQLIEAGLYLALTAAALGAAVLLLRRRAG
jgi:hypothetical protein